ncbi:vasopressin receptor activity [Sparganum proliferum]
MSDGSSIVVELLNISNTSVDNNDHLWNQSMSEVPFKNKTATDEKEVNNIGRIILLFMLTSNIIGNSSVLYVMCGRGSKKRMRFFIMNLAVTDLFVAIGGILPVFIWNLTVNFYAPEFVCKLVRYMSTTATYASSFALVVLSFDRAEAVINPLRSAKQKCFGVFRSQYLALCGWIAAFLCGIPCLLMAYIIENKNGNNCYLNFKYVSPRVYLTSVAVTVFILPAFFIALCHVLMVARIWQAASRNRDLSNREKPKFACGHTAAEAYPNVRREQNMIQVESVTEEHGRRKVVKFTGNTGCIPRARVKTVKMTLVIVSVYIMCWCPYMIWNLLVTFGAVDKSLPNFYKISPLIQHLVTLNSSANPLIFWIFSAHTIVTERRRNRRSKVVQRYQHRWSHRWRNKIICEQNNDNDNILLNTRNIDAQHSESEPPRNSREK